MSRINTNVSSLIAQRVLGNNTNNLNSSLERLSTGLRINRGKDDPAGLIASERLRSEAKSLNTAISNADRADQVSNIAEGGLQEISGLLTELQGLVTGTASKAGLSDDEKKANQLQVDSILQTIDRISSSTSFQGIKLLNGNFEFKTSSVAATVSDYRVNSAKFNGTSLAVDVQVTQSAQQAGQFLSFGGAAIDLTAGSKFVFEVAGNLGSRQLEFTSGTTLGTIAAAINTFTDVTGIKATASGTGIKLYSKEYGSDQFVSTKVSNAGGSAGSGIYDLAATNFNASKTSGATAFASASNALTDKGQDVGATINGIAATASGNNIRINTDFLDVEVTLKTSGSGGNAQALGTVGGSGNKAFYITGGGADFQLAGKVDIAGKVTLGINDVAVRKLGTSSLGFLSSLGSGQANNVATSSSLGTAQSIVSEAINQVSSLRGRLGAFQKNTVGATIRNLGVAVENTTAAQSAIRDADFATETAQLTRSQILVSASTTVLGQANQAPQSVLQLLR
ncbi:MAG: flagellin [Planctomycetota bacterium]|nr:flagellin [Planctomycetota bacterium]